MEHLIDIYEAGSMRVHRMSTGIVVDRGRIAGYETFAGTAFGRAELDALAPLTTKDQMYLRTTCPPESVQAHVAARIAAAQRIKFGRARKEVTDG